MAQTITNSCCSTKLIFLSLRIYNSCLIYASFTLSCCAFVLPYRRASGVLWELKASSNSERPACLLSLPPLCPTVTHNTGEARPGGPSLLPGSHTHTYATSSISTTTSSSTTTSTTTPRPLPRPIGLSVLYISMRLSSPLGEALRWSLCKDSSLLSRDS